MSKQHLKIIPMTDVKGTTIGAIITLDDELVRFDRVEPDDKACSIDEASLTAFKAFFDSGNFIFVFEDLSGQIIRLHVNELELPDIDLFELVMFLAVSRGISRENKSS